LEITPIIETGFANIVSFFGGVFTKFSQISCRNTLPACCGLHGWNRDRNR